MEISFSSCLALFSFSFFFDLIALASHTRTIFGSKVELIWIMRKLFDKSIQFTQPSLCGICFLFQDCFLFCCSRLFFIFLQVGEVDVISISGWTTRWHVFSDEDFMHNASQLFNAIIHRPLCDLCFWVHVKLTDFVVIVLWSWDSVGIFITILHSRPNSGPLFTKR